MITALESLVLKVAAAVLFLAVAWFWHVHTVSTARDDGDKAGYARALAVGQAKYETERERNLKAERAMREESRLKDEAAMKKEANYAETLSAAQRRMRASTDSLRCPATSTVHASAAPADRPVAGGSSPDEPGAGIVPEVAADILGLAADSARLVRKFDRLSERYDNCRALNNEQVSSPIAAPGG